MRPARGWFARAVVPAGLAVLLGAPALAAQSAQSAPLSTLGKPELAGGLGRTFAILGSVEEGGGSARLGARWPMGGASSLLKAGIDLWAADAGQTVERLLDPNDGVDLGAVGGPALTTYGGGLAAELHRGPGKSREASAALTGPYLGGTAGIYLVSSTLRGHSVRSQSAVGWSAGGGWHFRLGSRVTVGPAVYYHRVFDDELGRFMTAGLDWVWR